MMKALESALARKLLEKLGGWPALAIWIIGLVVTAVLWICAIAVLVWAVDWVGWAPW